MNVILLLVLILLLLSLLAEVVCAVLLLLEVLRVDLISFDVMESVTTVVYPLPGEVWDDPEMRAVSVDYIYRK